MNLRFMILLEMVDMVKQGGYLSPSGELCVELARRPPRAPRASRWRLGQSKPADNNHGMRLPPL